MKTKKLNVRVTGLIARGRSMVCAICMAFIFSFYNIVVKYADGTAETMKVLKTR